MVTKVKTPQELSVFIPPKPTDIPTDGTGQYIDWLGRSLEASRRAEWGNAYWYALEIALWAKNWPDQSIAMRMAEEFLERWRSTQ